LNSTVATQGFNVNLQKLLLIGFCDFFQFFSYI
jgi:hypothetical protein